MATSGSKSVAFTSWDTLRFSWTQKSQSIPNNNTVISWKLELVSGSDGRIDSSTTKTWTVIVNGTKYTGKVSVAIGNNTTKTLASGETTIAHNSNGSKTFSFSFAQVFEITFSGSWIGEVSGSGSGVLNTIPRASQPSLVTWPTTTQNVGDFGVEFSIHMNRASDAFTHTVRYEYGSRKGTIATGVGTGTTWTVPLAFMNDIPNATSGSGRIYVDTYNGSTLIGTKYTGFTATVPASVVPTCTFSVKDLVSQHGNSVQGISKLQVAVTTTPAYGSPVSCTVVLDSVRYSGTNITTGVLNTSGTRTLYIQLQDTRGRKKTYTMPVTVLAYTPPQVTSLTVHRCNQDGTANDQGAYIRAVFSAKVTKLGTAVQDAAAYAIRYKKSTATTWTEVPISALDGVYTVTNREYIFPAADVSSYDVAVDAADKYRTTTRATSASTAFSLFDWHPDGTGARFGGVAELSHTLQNDLELRQVGNRYAFNSPGVAGTSGFVHMASIEITAANADTPITFIFSRRQALTDMKVTIQLRNSAMTASSLSSIRYEGTNYGAFLVQTSTLVWDLYIQKGSNYDTIALQDWYTSSTMAGRIKVTFPGDLVDTVPNPYHRATPAVLESILDAFMPVGFVLTLYSHADPNDMYPGTTWVRITNGFLWAVDSSGTIGLTGGAKEVTLTVDQIPAHSHGSVYSGNVSGTKTHAWLASGGTAMAYGTVAAGGGAAHNNMPPYVQVSIWRRTA